MKPKPMFEIKENSLPAANPRRTAVTLITAKDCAPSTGTLPKRIAKKEGISITRNDLKM